QIPIWWRWCYWGSPVAWTIYGLTTSQLGDITSEIEVPGVGAIRVEAYLKQILCLDHDFLPVLAVMHLVFVLLCALLFALAIKHLNFQTR
ncbi:UNVERIFIED_CONTAM: ABC transporter G family member 39, partial [Sesamum indicum]